MRRTWRYVILAALGLSAAGALAAMVTREPAASTQPQRRTRAGDGPIPISAAHAVRADVPVYVEGVGTAAAVKTVTIRPQVEGKLLKVHFREGQDVAVGDVLASIEPTIYKARLDQALAKKAQTEAQLDNAKADLERLSRMTTGYVVQKTVDTQRALVAQLTAQLQSDSAAIDEARNNLEYTTIRAPIAGRTGIRLVDEGNILQPAATSAIVVLTQIRPIAVLFSLPQQKLRAVNQALAKGALAVEVMDAESGAVLDRGTLQVVDNQVDPATGTVRLKAEFPNERLGVWPGQFVTVRLQLELLDKVVTAPTAAIQRGPKGTFVFVVGPDETVRIRPVTLGQQDERRTVVLAGLEAGEQVAVNGFQRLSEGARVTVTPDRIEAPLPNATEPRRPENQAERTRTEGQPPGERQRRGERGERGNRNRPQNAPASQTQ